MSLTAPYAPPPVPERLLPPPGSTTALSPLQPRELGIEQGHRCGGTLLRRLDGGRGGRGQPGFLAPVPIAGVRATGAPDADGDIAFDVDVALEAAADVIAAAGGAGKLQPIALPI